MKIKHLHLIKMLALAASMTALTQAATVEVEWPDAWTDAPTTIWDCPSTTGYIATSYSSAYYTNTEGKKSIAAQYNVGTGSFVFPTEMYRGNDISIDGDTWLIMADGVLGNVASAKTEGNCTDSGSTITYDNITVIGGDANFYYTGDVSTALVMGSGLVLGGLNKLSGAGEHNIDIIFRNNVVGTARIYVDDNATVSSIIGGGYLYQNTSLDGSSGGTFTGSIVTESTAGATEISIAGGSVEGNIYGGGYASSVSVTGNESGKVTVTTNANILGDTSIVISDGSVGSGSSIILGGGMIGSAAGGATAQVLGNTQIDISGGTINAGIYGGIYGGGSNTNNVGNADVEGNTYINISGGTITGNVTASGLNYSDTYGDATITLSGDATISGNIIAETPTSTVLGTTTLNLGTEDEGYSETVQNVDGFDVVNVAEKSDTTVAGSFSNVGTLNVSGSLTLSESTDAASINIAENATLNITATGSTIFSNTSLDWENLGTVNISATDDAVTGFTYTIFASDVNAVDYGKITSSDGTISGNTYTVGTAGEDYTKVVLDTDEGTTVSGNSVVAISANNDDPTSIVVMDIKTTSSVTITAVSTVSESISFVEYLDKEDTDNLIEISAAYQFDLSKQLSDGDYVLISLYVGSDEYDVTQFTVYHKSSTEGSVWEIYEPTDLSYSDGYLSFTVYGFSSFGYSAAVASVDDGDGVVPEPSTATLSLMALAALMARRRRKN